MHHTTREGWLKHAVELMRPWFTELRRDIPELYVSVSFPMTGARSGRRIGECHYTSKDGKPHLLIHPYLDNPVDVLETLLHELIHGVLGAGKGHGKEFGELAAELGFLKPWTQTPSTPELRGVLADMVRRGLGPYPHAALQRYTAKQSTRQIKAMCPEPHGTNKKGEPEFYVARLTRKWIDYWTTQLGYIPCPCGQPMVIEEAA